MAKVIDKAKEIKNIMKDLDCTEAEAEEVFQMEEKARQNGVKNVCGTTAPRKTTKREPKVDEDKVKLLDFLMKALIEDSTATAIEKINPQREISFIFNEANYSITLTKHRPPKKAE